MKLINKIILESKALCFIKQYKKNKIKNPLKSLLQTKKSYLKRGMKKRLYNYFKQFNY